MCKYIAAVLNPACFFPPMSVTRHETHQQHGKGAVAVLHWLCSGKEGSRARAGHGGNKLLLARESVGGLDVVAHRSVLLLVL